MKKIFVYLCLAFLSIASLYGACANDIDMDGNQIHAVADVDIQTTTKNDIINAKSVKEYIEQRFGL